MNKSKILLLVFIMLTTLMVVGCASGNDQEASQGYKDITAEQLKEMLDKEQDIMLVDVREPEEYNNGHLAGSVLYPLGNIETWSQQLDKEQTLVMICRSGNRSAQAAQYLVEQGFTNVLNLKGGVSSWPYGLEEEIELPGNAA